MISMRSLLAGCLLVTVAVSAGSAVSAAGAASAASAATAAGAQSAEPRAEAPLVAQSFALKHQKATEAIQLVYSMLSAEGTVSLQPRSNTLIVRDTPQVVQRIEQVLRTFDHPALPLRLELIIVKASRNPPGSAPRPSDLPEPLAQRLRAWLPYDSYEKQGEAVVSTLEGEAAFFGVGGYYEVSFRVGTIEKGRRIKLSDFRITRPQAQGKTELIRTTLNLVLDQTLNLGLAKSEGSREALMVVLTVRQGGGRLPAGGRER
jgi:hypothetical protein